IWPKSVENCGAEASIHERVLLEEPGLVDEADIRVVTYDALGAEQELTGCGVEVVGSGDRIRVDVSATFDVMVPLVEQVVGDTIGLTGSAEVEVQGCPAVASPGPRSWRPRSPSRCCSCS